MRKPPASLSVGRAVSCGLVNLLATPGLGSLMGGRIMAGGCQLVLSFAGFLLITGWMCLFFYRQIREAAGQPTGPIPGDRLWQAGLVLFGIAWLWSLLTSISVVLQATTRKRVQSELLPPKIPDVNQ